APLSTAVAFSGKAVQRHRSPRPRGLPTTLVRSLASSRITHHAGVSLTPVVQPHRFVHFIEKRGQGGLDAIPIRDEGRPERIIEKGFGRNLDAPPKGDYRGFLLMPGEDEA